MPEGLGPTQVYALQTLRGDGLHPSLSESQRSLPATSEGHSDAENRAEADRRSVLFDTVVSDNVAPPDAATAPSKKYQAMLLLSGFFMIFQVIGLNTIYGVFQDFYTSQESNIPGAIGQDALVSLAGAVGAGLTWSGSIFVNPLMTRVKDVRIITVAGAFIMCFGLFFASFNTKLWHLYLTQALMYGIGSSMYYFPIMSIAPVYFDRHRGFAMGFILAGNGCGGLVLAPATNALISHLGIRWALRILGLVNLALAIPAACVVKQRPGYKVGGGLKVSMGLVKQGTFLWQSLGAFLQAAGNFVPMIYMATYSTSVLGYSASTASLVIALNNGVNSISRVLMGVLADRVGRQNTMFVGALLSALAVFALWFDAGRARFLVFVVFYGAVAGGYNALLQTTITDVFGVHNYPAVNGLIFFLRGIGSLAGAPVAGVILGSHSRTTSTSPNSSSSSSSMGAGMPDLWALRKRYNEVVYFDGALLAASALCIGYVRWLDARNKGRWAWKA